MFRGFGRTASLKSALTLLLLASVSPAVQLQPCFAKYAPQLQRVVASEKPTLDLIEKLGHQPELLTSDYLQYILGRPAKRNVSDVNNVVYHWVTNPAGIGSQDCELSETRDANHHLVKACFKVNLPRSTTTISDIEKKITGDSEMLASNNASSPPPRNPITPLVAPPAGSLFAAAPPSASAPPTTPATPALYTPNFQNWQDSQPSLMSLNPTGTLATGDPLNSLGTLDPFAPAAPAAPANSPSLPLRGPVTAAADNLLAAPPAMPPPPVLSAAQGPTGSPYTAPSGGAFTGSSSSGPYPGASTNQPVAQTGPKTAVKHLFDQACRPALQYSFVPYTNVFYMQAPNTFHVHHAEIVYAGPPLPPPSQLDIADAANAMRSRALGHHAKDSHNLAIPMLTDHLIDNPADAEAHYALGLSYQKSSNLNAAISEYQLALRYSNGDANISNKALQSLQQLHVIPAPDDQFAFHTLRFKQNGQGLTEGDVISTQDRQSLIAHRTPLSTTNAPQANHNQSPSYANYQPQSRFSPPPQPMYSSAAPNQQNAAGPRPISYAPSNNASAQRAGSLPAPTFYDSMNYGSNLFPATASNPNLEPGF